VESINEAINASGHTGAADANLQVDVRRFGDGVVSSPWGYTFEIRFYGRAPIGVRRPLDLSVQFEASAIHCSPPISPPNETHPVLDKVVIMTAESGGFNARHWPAYTALQEGQSYFIDVRSRSV